MIAGTAFLLCAFASVAIIAVIATLKATWGAEGGWANLVLAAVVVVLSTLAALHAFGVVA